MSSSEPSDREPAPSATVRDTRVEQLLLAGLDRYFAGELERAIQVWSRVFFLDRGHARARAYIERARGALAERQREAEARVYRPESPRSVMIEHGNSFGAQPDGVRETVVARRDFPGLGLGPAAARALPEVDVFPPEPDVLRSRAVPPAPRARLFTHVVLVVLAATLLFTAGYVVAARDELAAWWTVSSASELPPPVSATPAAQQVTGSSTRSRGLASR